MTSLLIVMFRLLSILGLHELSNSVEGLAIEFVRLLVQLQVVFAQFNTPSEFTVIFKGISPVMEYAISV